MFAVTAATVSATAVQSASVIIIGYTDRVLADVAVSYAKTRTTAVAVASSAKIAKRVGACAKQLHGAPSFAVGGCSGNCV